MVTTTDVRPAAGSSKSTSTNDEAKRRKLPVQAIKKFLGTLRKTSNDDEDQAIKKIPWHGTYEYEEVNPICRDFYLITRDPPSAEFGYRYPSCTNAQLRILETCHKFDHPGAKSWKPISSSRATKEFLADLRKPPTQEQKQCIETLRVAWNHSYWTPDIAIKSFFDIDKVYFGG